VRIVKSAIQVSRCIFNLLILVCKNKIRNIVCIRELQIISCILDLQPLSCRAVESTQSGRWHWRFLYY
jgi:hypothetical protein